MDKAYKRFLMTVPSGTFFKNAAEPAIENLTSPITTKDASTLRISPSCFMRRVEVHWEGNSLRLGPLGDVHPGFAALFAAYVVYRDGGDEDACSMPQQPTRFVPLTSYEGAEVGPDGIAGLATTLFAERGRKLHVLDPNAERLRENVPSMQGIVVRALNMLDRHDQQFLPGA